MPAKRQNRAEPSLPVAIIVTTVGKTYIGEFGDQPNDRWIVLTNGRMVLDDESREVVDPIAHLMKAAIKGPIAPVVLSEASVEALSIPCAIVQLMVSCDAKIWAPHLCKDWTPLPSLPKTASIRESVVTEWPKTP